MTPTIAVVVPYFQRRSGILERALAGVARQADVLLDAVEVIVVDDDSPVPAAAEVAAHAYGFKLTVLRRENGGPGAARNTALENLASSIEHVAFLDSDDVWSDDHLARGIAALERSGASFYFSNFFQLGATMPAFQRAGRLKLEEHREFGPDLYAYQGDMGGQILTGNVIGTSTVVYRISRHRMLRFQPQFRRAGEDYLMWLDFWRDGASFVFRWTPSVTYKEGVNVFSGVKWGTVEHLERTRDEIMYLSKALNDYPLPEAVRAKLRARIADRRRHYVRAVPSALWNSPLRTIRHLVAI